MAARKDPLILPLVQAAFLDLKVAGLLGQLLGRLVPILDRGVESMAVCTMVLEVILILMDPDACCLNPGLDAAQRVVDETPTIAEVGSFCPKLSQPRI